MTVHSRQSGEPRPRNLLLLALRRSFHFLTADSDANCYKSLLPMWTRPKRPRLCLRRSVYQQLTRRILQRTDPG